MNKNYKILVVGRTAWTGNNSTLENIFNRFDPSEISHICIESQPPSTKLCNRFFQISEGALIKRLLRPTQKTGAEYIGKAVVDNKIIQREQGLMSFVRRNRSIFFSFAREILWSFNGWKSKELKEYIEDVNPDVIFLMGDPLPLMNKLQDWVVHIANKPAMIFMMDDFYTYNSSNGVLKKIYKWLTRCQVKKVINRCSVHYAISPLMKSEYDTIFGIDSKILTKGCDFTKINYSPAEPKDAAAPIRLVYMGNLHYGRYSSIVELVDVINSNFKGKIELFVYTSQILNDKEQAAIEIEGVAHLMPPVPYIEVEETLRKYDLLLFVESLLSKYCNIARLSFSTKIVDYLSSSRTIFAIGPKNIAPIGYLRENKVARVASSKEEIAIQLSELLDHLEELQEYSRRAFELCKVNHNSEKFYKMISDDICHLLQNTDRL